MHSAFLLHLKLRILLLNIWKKDWLINQIILIQGPGKEEEALKIDVLNKLLLLFKIFKKHFMRKEN